MQTSHANRHAEAKVDLTPMLDVVFILLIFFIVTSNFIQEETLGLEGPPPGGANVLMPVILVSVDADNLIRVNGRLTQIDGARANMERLRAENPESMLIIQAHPSTPSGAVIRLRDLAYSANIERVSIVRAQEQ
ncbi:MAG: biopolymer transporter ExbD [Pseudomonadota bacterium]